MLLSRCEIQQLSARTGVLPSSPASKTQQATKHVDGTVFPYLDASSNLASSTPKKPNLLKNSRLGFLFLTVVQLVVQILSLTNAIVLDSGLWKICPIALTAPPTNNMKGFRGCAPKINRIYLPGLGQTATCPIIQNGIDKDDMNRTNTKAWVFSNEMDRTRFTRNIPKLK